MIGDQTTSMDVLEDAPMKPKKAKIIDRKGDERLGCACPQGYSLRIRNEADGVQELHCASCGALWSLRFIGYFEAEEGPK